MTFQLPTLTVAPTSRPWAARLVAGHVDLVEYEARLDQVFTAATQRELARRTGDLSLPVLNAPADRARRRRLTRLAVVVHAASAVLAVAVCWLVWLAVGLTADTWYPWPLWPTLGAPPESSRTAVPVAFIFSAEFATR